VLSSEDRRRDRAKTDWGGTGGKKVSDKSFMAKMSQYEEEGRVLKNSKASNAAKLGSGMKQQRKEENNWVKEERGKVKLGEDGNLAMSELAGLLTKTQERKGKRDRDRGGRERVMEDRKTKFLKAPLDTENDQSNNGRSTTANTAANKQQTGRTDASAYFS
jgi:hypothetical protein